MFLEKERKCVIGIKVVADQFNTSEENVRGKINCLELPQELQAKIRSGELPYSKARQLTILLRESPTPVGVGQMEKAPRTDKFYEEIKAQKVDRIRVTF